MWSLPSRSLAAVSILALLLIVNTSPVTAQNSSCPSPDPTARVNIHPNPPPDVNLIGNGGFTNGMSCWWSHATPDPNHIVTQTTNGMLEFYRVPQPAGERSNQAVVFQLTGVSLPEQAPLSASFDLGNSSNIRKRISVLLVDFDFSDIRVCTFWLPANAPLQTYRMRTFSRKPWFNTTVAFYAASPGSVGGFYQVDNVSVMYDPEGDADRTLCVDPTSPPATGGPDGPTLLVNGDFSNGLAPWAVFHRITSQITDGVFEFIWPDQPEDNNGPMIPDFEPAPTVIQRTGQTMTAGEVLRADVDLGNSSAVWKRVSVLIHDWDFSDLAACTFWLAPGAPRQTYTMRMFTTQPWSDAAFSVYAATQGPESWIEVDNAVFRRTGEATGGKECYEPGALTVPPVAGAQGLQTRGPGARSVVATGSGTRGLKAPGSSAGSIAGRAGGVATAPAPAELSGLVQYALAPGGVTRALQVSADGEEWHTVMIAEPSEDWRVVTLDVGDVGGRALFIRLVGS
jgi:hypothetical protein